MLNIKLVYDKYGHGQIDSASDPDQEYICFMVS